MSLLHISLATLNYIITVLFFFQAELPQSSKLMVKVEFVQALVRRIKKLLKLKATPFQTFK
jgi:hypothetical protein